ncbi:hypothetical protein [Amnibacterium kyonggiense]|uniref:Uncharacterized protein n=1 Tax=Amnibacterium kyonggiense TaxID=595671 RepID=A0A4V3EB41_9MICO|nr:hypothetical protein [Amnibacterium kyonggiense]TDS80224.1 hypothetical protein CLV52_0779 [Amnibacterium kyonggiense]
MIEIDWSKFAIVAGVVLGATILLTLFCSGGVRLLETAGASSAAARVGAYACFAVCIAAVLFGLWVIVPQFH